MTKLTGLSKQKNLQNFIGNRCSTTWCKYREFCIEFEDENIINNNINETEMLTDFACIGV
jgi:hypothetical protein